MTRHCATRVLCLVHEDVVEPAVEAPEHPGCRSGRGEKRVGPVDHVVEVEQSPARLGSRVGREPGAAEPSECNGWGENGQGEPLRPRGSDPIHQPVELFAE